jgi:GDPmannose 4,6-dehydratase
VARILLGQQEKLYLGNLDAKRDWGYAPEYMELMWLLLQQDGAGDYVVGTGEPHSVREFVEEAFSYVGLNWQEYIEIDSRYFRPLEVDWLVADSSIAREKLGWIPRVSFHELVRIMIDADMEAVGLEPVGDGEKILEEKCPNWHQWSSSVTSVLRNHKRALG